MREKKESENIQGTSYPPHAAARVFSPRNRFVFYFGGDSGARPLFSLEYVSYRFYLFLLRSARKGGCR